MLTTKIAATIDRRLLVNYRIEPEVIARLLPEPFRPQLVGGWGIGGICFLALKSVRPTGLPAWIGISSENVAHRFAVEWDGPEGHVMTGVLVPQRHTDSRLTSIGGGRLFDGVYHPAHFKVDDRGSQVGIEVSGDRDSLAISVVVNDSERLDGELFGSLVDAVAFFKAGPLGASPGAQPGSFDCVRLDCARWGASPVAVQRIASSVFDDKAMFPDRSCTLDSALLMRNLEVTWTSTGAPFEMARTR